MPHEESKAGETPEEKTPPEPPRDLSPEDLEELERIERVGNPSADKTAVQPDLTDEPELPHTLSGEPFPEGDYQSLEGTPGELVPRETPSNADATALPDAEGELPHTLSGEAFPGRSDRELREAEAAADYAPDAGEAEAGDADAEEEGESPSGEPPFEVEEPVAFDTSEEKTPFGAPPVVAVRTGDPVRYATGSISSQQLTAAALRPHDPFEESSRSNTQVSGPEELAPDAGLEAILITQERIDALWNEINDTYNAVILDVRGHYTTTEVAITDLKHARELLLAGEEHFDNAEEVVKRVKARLRLEEKVRQWSRTRGTWLAVYLILWLLVLAVATFLSSRFVEMTQSIVPQWMAVIVLPVLYGGIGGVVGALWVLIKHIVKVRDFDPIHTPWYVINPFMGMALGGITYFLLRASTLILGAAPVALGDPGEQFGLYFLSVVVGFNQNVLWELIDRVLGAVLPSEKTAATTEAATSTELSQD